MESLCYNLLLKAELAVISDQVAEGFIHLGPENLQEWRLHNFFDQLAALLGCSCGE